MAHQASFGVTFPAATAASSDDEAVTVLAAVVIGGSGNAIGESFRGGIFAIETLPDGCELRSVQVTVAARAPKPFAFVQDGKARWRPCTAAISRVHKQTNSISAATGLALDGQRYRSL